MTGKTLTEPPENLKDAIDWVLWISGSDRERISKGGIKDLSEQIIRMSRREITNNLQIVTVLEADAEFGTDKKKPITYLAKGLACLIGYNNGIVKGSDIGKYNAYQSTYHRYPHFSQCLSGKERDAVIICLSSIPIILRTELPVLEI
ncbi:variant erythrocyte surface antigen-1 family protein [Babesia caballi]|uniref:Variant erythrocyte surface antigen-1 family protein n=1 Tax=Babesia caballi TaxID=5871 RepID=A0AAV4LVQ1_BABCB|nr:variant erythrocyte surface antigen-1 family protein [Babesia caballi]